MNNSFDRHFRGGGDLVETTKQVHVLDRFGNVRFVVRLDKETPEYVIRVYSVQDGSVGDILVKEGFQLYKQAQAFFRKMVDRYSALVKAETLGPRDIRIYAERIKYHEVAVACCATCRYGCRFVDGQGVFGPRAEAMKGKLLCANDAMLDPLREQDAERLGIKPGRDLRPVVDAGCVCMGYEKRQSSGSPLAVGRPPAMFHPHPDQDERIAKVIEEVLSDKMGEIADNVVSIAGDDIASIAIHGISADVQQHIDDASQAVIDTISADIQNQVNNMVVTGNDDLDTVYHGGYGA